MLEGRITAITKLRDQFIFVVENEFENRYNEITGRFLLPADNPEMVQYLDNFRNGDFVVIEGRFSSFELNREYQNDFIIEKISYRDSTPGVYALVVLDNTANYRYRVYISSSRNLCFKWREDKSALEDQRHDCSALQEMFNEGKLSNAQFVMLKMLDVTDDNLPVLQRNERYFWKMFQAAGVGLIGDDPYELDTRLGNANFSDGVKYPTNDPTLFPTENSDTILEILTSGNELTAAHFELLSARYLSNV